MKKFTLTVMTLLIVFSLSAQWANKYDNQIVVDTDGPQWQQVVVADDQGGIFVVWQDERNGTSQIYVQHLDSMGNVSFAEDGKAVAATSANQVGVQAVSDEAGGVIIAWEDLRDNTTLRDIYAQRVDKTGQLMWGAGGNAVCNFESETADISMDKDGTGGALIAWKDNGNVQQNRKAGFYMQRINANGQSQWTACGELVHPKVGNVFSNEVKMQITSDGNGGALMIYNETVLDVQKHSNVYGHYVDQNGSRHWEPDNDTLANLVIERGYPISKENNSQNRAMAHYDGNGNFYVMWQDFRNNGLQNGDLYGQRLNMTGTYLWDSSGKNLTTGDLGANVHHDFIADEQGIYVSYLSGTSAWELKRFLTNGSNPWTSKISVTNTGVAYAPLRLSSQNEVVLAWIDDRNTDQFVMAQRVDKNGNKAFSQDITVSNYPEDKDFIRMDVGVNDRTGICWIDYRRKGGASHGGADRDLYAQGFGRNGEIGNSTGIEPGAMMENGMMIRSMGDLVRISLEEPLNEGGILEVFDLAGRRIHRSIWPSHIRVKEINLSGESTGMVIITLTSPDTMLTGKLLH